jgi:peptidoglycan-associated lipoprotein
LAGVEDIYFNVGKSEVKEEYRRALLQDGDTLKVAFHDFPSGKVVVEGHCDKRGPFDGNILLGYRRATAVRKFLIDYGIPAERLNVASFGNESPQCIDAREECWQKNRRVHLAPAE